MNCPFCIVILLLCISAGSKVDTVLFAPWTSSSQSMILEASEFFATYGADDFQQYLKETISEKTEELENKKQIIWIVDYCKRHYADHSCELLKLSLISREYLPKMQLYQDLVQPFISLCESKSSFLLSKDGYTCEPSFSELTPFPDSFNSQEIDSLLDPQSFDHFLFESSSSPMILYSTYQKDLLEWINALSNHSVVIRPFQPSSLNRHSSSRLSGYGIALDIKNTEYKVIDDRTSESTLNANDDVSGEMQLDVEGFNFGVLKERYPELSSTLEEFKNSLLISDSQTAESITPIQMKDIGLKVIQRVRHSSNPLKYLNEITENFPKVAPSIARIPVGEDLREEIESILQTYGDYRGNVIINNRSIRFNSGDFNVFSLIQSIRDSFSFVESQKSLNLSSADILTLTELVNQVDDNGNLSVRLSLEDQNHPSILFVNDIEKDMMYSRFSTRIHTFFTASFSFPRVRSNFISRVFVLDPLSEESYGVYNMMYELLQSLPIRMGFLFTSPAIKELLREESSVKEVNVKEDVNSLQAVQLVYGLFNLDRRIESVIFLNNLVGGKDHSIKSAVELFDDLSDSSDGLAILTKGLFINEIREMVKFIESRGLSEGQEILNGQVFETLSFKEFMEVTYQEIGKIVEGVNSKEIKELNGILPYLMKDALIVNCFNTKLYAPFKEQEFVTLDKDLITEHPITIQENGKRFMIVSIPSIDHLDSMISLLSDTHLLKDMTVAITSPEESLFSLLLLLNQAMKHDLLPSMNEVLLCYKQGSSLESCMELYLETEEIELLDANWSDNESMKNWNDRITPYFSKTTQPAIILNGRFIELSSITTSSLKALVSMDSSFSGLVKEAFPSISPVILLPFIHRYYDELSLRFPSLPSSSPFLLVKDIPDSLISITAVIDPLTVQGQRAIAIFNEIQQVVPLSYHILLVPQTDYSELPLKRFYRYVLNADENAVLWDLPQHYLYTMSPEVPYKWNVVSYYAEADLDNLRVVNDDSFILAQYIVDGVIVEGSCYEEDSPASGVMLQLSHYGNDTIVSDTVVMNNRGYFQLRGKMGLFDISVSKDSEGYQLLNDEEPIKSKQVYLWNNLDETVQLSIVKQENKPQKEPGLFEKMGSAFFTKHKTTLNSLAEEEEEINVFSLASGHLYERFIKIMMRSVSMSASKKVHFWLIENFLSPQFKVDLVPSLCEHFGYKVSYVSYKWPRWVYPQTEKQRIIWAYKILFLDVLFPLSVKKIVYVDADQVMRVDINELWEMDIHDHVYAYTPLCTSNPETKGFMFWTQGYWKDHLRGKPYHISALYKVDLELLRQRGVGDVLRSVYNQLAPDPNSLSNLDQDLPNFIQDQVPIYSLPQEWLWCESWCSMESKKDAKTIDLCNNPLHKEPKLDMAKRVISGELFERNWVSLDDEIHEFENSILSEHKRQPARV